MKNVTIFSTSTCKYCAAAKEFFKANNIPYTEYNVGTDAAKRKEMLEKSGQLGVPVILVGEAGGKEEVVVGFDEPKLRELLLAK
jgi:glutaredoxin